MLDRPYHDLSGRRQVPKLVNANRVPFLRVKKPQSPYVSRIIRNTVKTREKRIALSARLAEQIPIAQTEDKWDDIIFKVFGLEEVTGSAWSHELHQAIHENQNLQTSAIQKRADLSARMHSIVEQEKMLAAEEEQLMKKEKYQRIKDRRLARKENPTPVVEQERLLDSAEAAPDKLKPDMAVHDKDHYKTREEIEQMGAENEHSRTDEEVADIKSARVRRREERLKQKSEKAKRQAENVLFWRNKLGT